MKFVYDDGGRANAGYDGKTGDCVTRAIAIATGEPYQKVYDELRERSRRYAANATRRNRVAAAMVRLGHSPRNGMFKEVYDPYLRSLGWEGVPTMRIGSGCKVHLRAEELPAGRLIVSVSKHLCAVVDGILYDNHDCSRNGTRCVYGYYRKRV